MRKVALSFLLVGSLAASSAAQAAATSTVFGGSASHGVGSASPTLYQGHVASPATSELQTLRLLGINNNTGTTSSLCNMPTYSADKNCQ